MCQARSDSSPHHHEGGHSPQPAEFAVYLRHARATPYLRGQEWDEDVETPHQKRGGTMGKGQQEHSAEWGTGFPVPLIVLQRNTE